jgi:hypothetical protein
MELNLNQEDELLCKECGNETNIKYYELTEDKTCLICFNCGGSIKINNI